MLSRIKPCVCRICKKAYRHQGALLVLSMIQPDMFNYSTSVNLNLINVSFLVSSISQNCKLCVKLCFDVLLACDINVLSTGCYYWRISIQSSTQIVLRHNVDWNTGQNTTHTTELKRWAFQHLSLGLEFTVKKWFVIVSLIACKVHKPHIKSEFILTVLQKDQF